MEFTLALAAFCGLMSVKAAIGKDTWNCVIQAFLCSFNLWVALSRLFAS